MATTDPHAHPEPADDPETFFGEAAWEERYSASETGIWSGKPNPALVAEVSELAPGTALEVGCGEGADALWLAARGWRVTATDISTVALKRAAAQGKAQGLDVEWRHVDLRTDPPQPAAYDLVTAHYMHLPKAERVRLYNQLGAAVAPGGTLLLVGHHPAGMPEHMKHPNQFEMLFTPEQLVAELDPREWDVLLAESRPRQTRDPEGREVTIDDALLKARRRRPKPLA